MKRFEEKESEDEFNYPGLDEQHYRNLEKLTKSSKQEIMERFVDFEELLKKNLHRITFDDPKNDDVKNKDLRRLNLFLKRINKRISEFHHKNKINADVETVRGLVYFYFPKIVYSSFLIGKVSKREVINEIEERIETHKKEYEYINECLKLLKHCVKYPYAERRGLTPRVYTSFILTGRHYCNCEVNSNNEKVGSRNVSLYDIFNTFHEDIKDIYNGVKKREKKILKDYEKGSKKGVIPVKSRKAQVKLFKKLKKVQKVSDYSIIKLIAQIKIYMSGKSSVISKPELKRMMNAIKSQLHEDSIRALKN